MTLLEMAEEPSHRRTVEISTHRVDDTHVLAVGELKDLRLKEYYLITGEKKEAGTIHHMKVALLVDTARMIIEDAELEMNAVPREVCRELGDFIERIKGLSISKGFTLKVRSLLGGCEGCTHVMTLVIDMAPAVLQGYWTIRSSKPLDLKSAGDKKRIRMMEAALKNTCHVWREDGPSYKKLKEELESID